MNGIKMQLLGLSILIVTSAIYIHEAGSLFLGFEVTIGFIAILCGIYVD